MIPKVIHYVWFGGKPLGDFEKKCIESWKKFLPDYKIICWDENNFDIESNAYCFEAYQNKKWAFASDYVRLWALVKYGGIYMDTDVEVIGSLDSFLSLKAFAGFESETTIATGILGSEANHPAFRDLLSSYDNRHFMLSDGSMDLTTNVTVFTDFLRARGLIQENILQTVSGITLYPCEFFCPKSYSSGMLQITDNSVAIHHFNGSWVDDDSRSISEFKYKIIRHFPFIPIKIAGLISCLYFCYEHKSLSQLNHYFKRYLNDKNNRFVKK